MTSIRPIEIRGARTHNLKNIDLDLPRGEFIVITGVSGSGKSSLAIDTLFAEGQRQYLESLSSYARQFVDQLERPEVDSIRGLQPSLCIHQQQGSLSPRSTVGTVTEIYDYVRLLMARVATPACHRCGDPIVRQSPMDIHRAITRLPAESKLTLLAPMVIGRKGAHADVFERIAKAGLVRAKVDGALYELDDLPTLSLRKEHTIAAVVDRLILRDDNLLRLEESIAAALRLSNGLIEIQWQERGSDEPPTERLFSTRYACLRCDIHLIEIEPRTFSFNSPYGACSVCEGFGVVGDARSVCPECNGARLKKESLAIKLNGLSVFDLVQMSLSQLRDWFQHVTFDPNLESIGAPIVREIQSRSQFLCDVGLQYLTLDRDAASLSGGELQRVRLATSIGTGLTGVCYVLDEPSVGLHPRDTRTLIHSLRQLQSKGNTVIVVEHDNELMLASDRIIDFGPSAGKLGGRIVANASPSELAHQDSVKRFPESITAKHLSSNIVLPTSRLRPIPTDHPHLELQGIHLHNAVGLNVRIPLQRLVGVSGVSGSGKSTVIEDTLRPALHAFLQNAPEKFPSHLKKLKGQDGIRKLIAVDQSPIGRSPRSTAATYCGFWDDIRKVFAATRDAKQRGFGPSHFSFNSGPGRCDACAGQGRQKLEMNFLADVYVTCVQCRGSRFQRSIRAVRFKEKSIVQVLEMPIAEARDYFSEIPRLRTPLECLVRVGLGYMPLGQPATTMSGGEAQRVKLASELANLNSAGAIYLLDEPTSGLHADDVHRLIEVLQDLVEQGASVVVVEHHSDLLNACDWIIDMGPGPGKEGGQIVGEGNPRQISQLSSPTGQALANLALGHAPPPATKIRPRKSEDS